MKIHIRVILQSLLTVSLFAGAMGLRAQGTAFTYQGLLNAGGLPASGSYDLTFQLFNAVSNGTQVGSTVTNSATAVNNGLFTVTLNFGAGVFTGSNYWVEIGARTNGSAAFTNLSPLLPITTTPYAIAAGTASNALTAAALSGTVSNGSLSGTYTSPVTFNNTSNSFTGNGAGLINVTAANLSGTVSNGSLSGSYTSPVVLSNANNVFVGSGAGLSNVPNVWNLTGNAGTSPGVNFVGTTDNQPLQLRANGSRAFLLDGTANAAQPNVIGGSGSNSVAPGVSGATIAGGFSSAIQTGATFAAIGGGTSNVIGTGAYECTIAGGVFNAIGTGAYESTIAGGYTNNIQTGANESTIAGGGYNTIQSNASGSFIGGGAANNIQSNASGSFIGGGVANIIQTNAYDSTIAGGGANTIQTNANSSTIVGGAGNTIQTNATYSTIAGGYNNTIQTNANYSTIAGGYENTILGAGAFVGGGGFDGTSFLGNTAGGNASTIGGGLTNFIQTNANYATIAGGIGNTIQVGAQCAAIPGGSNNLAAGNYSFAAGQQAQATNQGAFVWADSQPAPFASTNSDSFNVRAQGGVRIYDNLGATAGVSLASNATAWTSLSDRNAKKNFQPVDTVGILNKLAAIPIQRWNYKWEKDGDAPNIGPMAQDFKGAFYPGRDDKGITTLEFDGVELAAIQGLNQKLEAELKAKDAKIASMEKEISGWDARFNKLEQTVAFMAGKTSPTLAVNSPVKDKE